MTALRSFRSVRLSLVRERLPAVSPFARAVRHGGDVAELARLVLGDDPREGMLAVYLDARRKVLAIHRVSIGTCDVAPVHPREVFGPALQLCAQALVLAHNHPSGDPCPSPEDRTDRLTKAGELLGVELLDHVVLGSERFYTFSSGGTFTYGAP